MRKSFFYAMVALLMMALVGCSDDDGLGASELCHAWYWHDEMPKNYYDLVVYKNNGTIESVAIINTDDGPRKKVLNHGSYHLNGDRLTCRWDGIEEAFTYRIVIEKTGEDGYTMYQYSDGEDTQSWYNTYYTSDNMDKTYLNTPALDDEADYAETLDGRWLLVKANYGYLGGIMKYEAGQTVLKINLADKTMTVSHSKEGADDTFLKSGVYSFTTATEQSRIYTYKWVDEEHQIIKIKMTDEFGDHEHKYMYSVKDGMLYFDGGVAYDGDGYLFSRY